MTTFEIRESLRHRVLDIMGDGRERTAQDLAYKLDVPMDAAATVAGILVRNRKLRSTTIRKTRVFRAAE